MSRTAFCVALALLLIAPAAFGAQDMKYVDGLIALGYYDLAAENLEAMRGRADIAEEDKTLIPLRLGVVYSVLASRETDPAARERRVNQASLMLDEFAKKNPSSPMIVDVRLQQVDLLTSRAQTAEMKLNAEPDAKKKEPLLKDLEALYAKGIAEAQAIAEDSGKKARELRSKIGTTKKAEEDFWTQYGAQVRGLFLAGHLNYLWSHVYAMDSPERPKRLAEALAQFEEAIRQRPQTNVTFEAQVRRGLCLRELSAFEKKSEDAKGRLRSALGAFDAALGVAPADETMRTRAEAYYQKALTAYAMESYEAAASAAETFVLAYPEGADSPRAQEGALLRARSLGKLAEQQLTKREAAWEVSYNEAMRAVRELRAGYPSVLLAADKLVQGWNDVFPGHTVLFTPLAASAEARKLWDAGKPDEAIMKYQDVITLAGPGDEWSGLAQDAWRSIAKIHYAAKRYAMAAIAWQELIARYPATAQGADIAWVRVRMFGWLYGGAGNRKDRFDLDQYLEGLQFFVDKFPKDARAGEAQAELAKVAAPAPN